MTWRWRGWLRLRLGLRLWLARTAYAVGAGLGIAVLTIFWSAVAVFTAVLVLVAWLLFGSRPPRRRVKPLDPHIMCRGEGWLSGRGMAPPDKVVTLDQFAEPDRKAIEEAARRSTNQEGPC